MWDNPDSNHVNNFIDLASYTSITLDLTGQDLNHRCGEELFPICQQLKSFHRGCLAKNHSTFAASLCAMCMQ